MKFFRLSICTFALATIAACGGAGGDSGVVVPDNVAIDAVAPLVGVWDLPGDWNGTSDDEANLVIRSPDDQGVAVAIIYDFDDAELNCFRIDGGEGQLSQSLNDDLFLDLPVYSLAVAELQPSGELEISVFAEGAVSGTPPERVLTATRLNLTENELNLCT